MRRDARTTHAGGKTFQFSHVRSMRPAMLAANASNVNISILASMQNATTNPIAGDGTLIISILACVQNATTGHQTIHSTGEISILACV